MPEKTAGLADDCSPTDPLTPQTFSASFHVVESCENEGFWSLSAEDLHNIAIFLVDPALVSFIDAIPIVASSVPRTEAG